jgi:hypothetical protein
MTQLHLDTAVDVRKYQWFTPEWAAVELVERYFPDLSTSDLVLEPSCGAGAFLKAIPDQIPALGVEVDPGVAELCRANTGRQVLCGDFRSIPLPPGITRAIGNPPFAVHLINDFLSRLSKMEEMRQCGFLLPAYSMQTHNTVVPWLEHWKMTSELIPRRLFPRLKLPLVFILFDRSKSRDMVGFALYEESVQFENLHKRAQKVLREGVPRKGVWRALVDDVMEWAAKPISSKFTKRSSRAVRRRTHGGGRRCGRFCSAATSRWRVEGGGFVKKLAFDQLLGEKPLRPRIIGTETGIYVRATCTAEEARELAAARSVLGAPDAQRANDDEEAILKHNAPKVKEFLRVKYCKYVCYEFPDGTLRWIPDQLERHRRRQKYLRMMARKRSGNRNRR